MENRYAPHAFVDPELRGMQLEDWLQRRWPEANRRLLRRAIRAGDVTVNGATVHPQHRLAAGDYIAWEFDDEEVVTRHQPVEEPTELPILCEDEQILIVDKPAGMHTVPDRAGKYRGVHGVLGELRPGGDLRVVHRLDQGTSGCLVLAKGLPAAQALDLAFRAGRVHKEYVALVDGTLSRSAFEITRHLGPDRRRPGRVRAVAAGTKGARAARTEVRLEEQFRSWALVRALPRTGRSHQIRVHLQSVGHPIAGDREYGSGQPLLLSRLKPRFKIRPGVAERPLLGRMFLHAEVVAVTLVEGAPPVRAVAPLPDELQVVLTKLRRFAPEGRQRCD